MDKTLKNIEAMNCEAQQFLESFVRFRGGAHAIDQSLCMNLMKVISEVDDFLDSKPKEISVPQREQLMPADLKKLGIYKAFFCRQCGVELSQSLENVRGHLKSGRHNSKWDKERVKRNTLSRIDKMENKLLPKKAKSLIQGDIQTFITENMTVSEKLITLPDYKVIEDELMKLIRPAYPDQSLKLYLFGSRISGIGSIYSDLDIFIDIGDVFNNFENRPSPETINKLKTVQELLKNNPDWSRLIAIQNARVPILKIFHKSTSTNCDIGFSNSLGFCNTKLTKYLLELQPLAKAMCLFLKKWLERTKLNEHITTYSTILLVVGFLQIKKVLPSIQSLQEGLEDPVQIGPWMATFIERPLDFLNIKPASYSLNNFKKTLKQFFKFYSAFDFEHMLICPYLGNTMQLAHVDTSEHLPRYVQYLETEKDNKDAQLKKNCMNVQDPFQLNHNVTKAVPVTVVRLLKQYFELSANLLGDAGIPEIDDDEENHEK